MQQSITLPAALLALSLLSLGCHKEEAAKPKERPPVAVETGPVKLTDLPRTVDIVGTLYGDEEVVVSAKVAGRVTSVAADVGDRVAGGQTLAQIDKVDYDLAVQLRQSALSEALARLGISELPGPDFDLVKTSPVERARYQSENAQAKLTRAQKLFEQKPPLISEQEFADLRTAYEVSQRDFEVAKLDAQSLVAAAQSRKAELDSAKQQAADTRIAAPAVAGERKFAVSQRMVTVGEYVSTATPTFRLVLDDVLKFRGALPERFVNEVKIGQPVMLRVDGIEQPSMGKVTRINPAIDMATRTFQVEALFANTDGRLRPGAFGRGQIEVGRDENVVMVPKSALSSFAGIDKVFTVKDGKAVEHRVLPGAERDGWIPLDVDLGGERTVVISKVGQLANQTVLEVTATTQPATAPAK
ncbi:MAG TPA: efflux RND transporter periplasmic adaptor subunit [Tepidisphaeraceae bacterium]|jgi:RND family efflux transporter MFP subunit